MIYYFSGTGNSKWIAEQLASITDDIALDIMDSSTSRLIEVQNPFMLRINVLHARYV